MEANGDRQKKLEAGKERLAAFRKKKTRKKEPEAVKGKSFNAHEVEDIGKSEESSAKAQKLSPPPLSDVRDVWSGDSDQFTDTSGDEWSSEENEARSTLFFESKLAQAKQRISELEEIVAGKQLALDAAIKKLEPARGQHISHHQRTEESETSDIESALAQRDALLSQLSASLFETLGNAEQDSNFESQMSSMAQNVFQLQSQLQRADQALQDQLVLQGSSTKALQEARSQMLQLQEIIVHKDRQMTSLLQEKEQIHKQENDPQFQLSQTQIESELRSVKEVLLEKEQELVSKEQLWTYREQEWATREYEWIHRDQERAAREETLQASIEVQSSKIASLMSSGETLKTEHEDLKANCSLLESQVERLQSEQSKLAGLENELDQLRQDHTSDQMQIDALNQAKTDLEDVVSRQSQELANFTSLNQEHNDLRASYSECLSKLSDLEKAKASLEEQLRTLQSSVADTDSLTTELHGLKMSYEEEAEKQSQNQIVQLEKKHSFTTDALNNKINELQNILHKTEAALLNATKSADAEKLLASSLKKSIQNKDEKVSAQSLQLAELESSLRSLESNNKEIEAALLGKEDVVKDLKQQLQLAEQNLNCNNNISKQIEANEIEIQNLKHQLKTSEDQLRMKEEEACKYIEKISALEGELTSSNSIQNKQLLEFQLAKDAAETKRFEIEQELELNSRDRSVLLNRLQLFVKKLNQCHVEQEGLNETVILSESETPFQTDYYKVFENELQSIFSQLHSLIEVCDEQKKKISHADALVCKLEENLKENEDQLSSAQTELKSLQESAEVTRLQRESEIDNIQRMEQEMESKNIALGELQSQLENTVLNWQKLQRIVQEKEVDLQNTQEALEEQHRVCLTLKRTFEEEKEELLSELQTQKEAFHHEKKQSNFVTNELEELKGRMQVTENESNILQKEKDSQIAIFASLFDIVQREVTSLKDRSRLMETEFCYSPEKDKEQILETEKSFVREKENFDKESILSQDRSDINISDHLAMLKAGDNSLETSLEEIFSALKAQFDFFHKMLKVKNNAVEDLGHTNAKQKERVESLEVELVNMRQVCDSIIKSTNMGVDRIEGLQAVFNQKDDEITQLQNKVTKLKEETERNDQRAYKAELSLKDVVKEKEETAAKVLEMAQQQSDHEENYKHLYSSYQKIQEELNIKEKSLVFTLEQNEAINSELTQLKQKVCEEAQRYELLQASCLKTENDLSESQVKCETLLADKVHTNSQLSDLMEKISEYEKKYNAMESAYAVLESKLMEKEDFIRSFASEKDSLMTEFEHLKEQNCTTESELGSQKIKIDELQEALHNSEDKLVSIHKLKLSLEEELAHSKQEVGDSHGKVASLEAYISELKEELESLEKEKDKAAETASQLHDEQFGVKTAYEELCSKNSQLVTNLGDLETTLQTLTKDNETLESELLGCKQKNSDIENKYQCLEASLLKMEADAEEKSNTIETLNKALADKNQDIAVFEKERHYLRETVSQRTSAIEESQIYCSALNEKYEHLLNMCSEKDKTLKELEAKTAGLTQEAQCVSGFLSNVMQDLQEKDELLLIQAKEASDLKSIVANLKEDIQEKNSLIQEHLQSLSNMQEQSNQYSLTLENNNKDKVKLETEISALETALALKTRHLSESEEQFALEKSSHEQTVKMLETAQITALRMQNQLSYMSDCLQEKEASLIGTEIISNEKADEVVLLTGELEKANLVIEDLTELNESLKQEHSLVQSHLKSVQSANSSLETEIVQLKADLEGQELANTQSTVECKKLRENITQMSQTLSEKEGLLYNLRQDIEMYQKEITDIRADVEHREIKVTELQGEISVSKISLEKKHEEGETLKSNFDSCMAEMQVRLHEQETEIKDLRSQLAEESRTVQQGQDHLREIFEIQVNQMEEKLSKSEELKETLERELEDTKLKACSTKELYERQISELEINLQTASSDVVRLKDELSQAYNNHECALAGVRRLHEIQTVELEDNCLSLEKTVAEQKRQLCELQVKFNKEKADLEQNFEIQMSETEEKRRFSELEIDRLKRHLEEMKADHVQDKKHLEKSYESRLFELEDKYCVTMGELDRLRASLRDPSGAQHNDVLLIESRLQEVEAIRRELEMRNRALDDEVVALKESLRVREEEMMVVLKDAAERHKEDTNQLSQELNSANEQMATQNQQHSSYIEKLMKDHEEQVLDLRSRNNQLKEKVNALDMHMDFEEEFGELQKKAAESQVEVTQLNDKISQLSEENHSLKRQLFLQGHKVRLERNSIGLEDICPSYSPENFSETATTTDSAFAVPEGFVHEHFKPLKPRTLERESLDCDGQEPDFVEEQVEGFQPELDSEMIVDSSHQLNVHPISEAEPTEGFQPESPDGFVLEAQDDEIQHRLSLSGLSVGSSPSYHSSQKFNFPAALPHSQTRVEDAISNSPDFQMQGLNDAIDTKDKTDSVESKDEEAVLKITVKELEKKIQAVRDEMEEHYVTQLRRQEVDLTHEFSSKHEELQRDLEHSYNQQLQSVKYEWERKFTKALQKVRREMEKHHQGQGQITSPNTQILSSQAAASKDSSPKGAGPGDQIDNISESCEEQVSLGETVQQLHKENQELAEVRDVLLRQIELSQARGLHTKMQHELQSMICNRDIAATTAPETSSTSSEATTPTCSAVSPTFEEAVDGSEDKCSNEKQGKLLTDTVRDRPFASYQDGKEERETTPTEGDEVLSARASEASETSSARERFLEELEDMTQPSCQDLPLEWELTNTLVAPALISSGDGGEEPAPGGQHQSIWEVFDGRCVRQDCQEVRLQLFRLTKFLRDLSAQTQGDDAVPAETLRIQYEHQLSSLQRQLEAERRNNQEHAGLKKQQYEQAVTELQTALDQDQKTALDVVLTQLSQLHIGEIKQLQAEHQNDICLELTALKLSMEQVYVSKAEIEARESELKHEQRMEALNRQHKEDLNKLSKQHKEELNKLAATGGTPLTDAAQSLTEQYNEMVKNICQDLQKIFKPRKAKCNSIGINGDTLSDEEDEQELVSSQDIQAILHQQQADISLLKSRLQSGSEIKEHSSSNGDSSSDLELQIASLKRQYESQVEEINSSFRKRDEEQKQELAEYSQQLETQQNNLKSHYEERISNMETSFDTQISNMKDKYEQQISELIHSRLSDVTGESGQDRDLGTLLTNLDTPQQREYVQKTMAITAVSDTDSDLSLDTSRPVQTDDYVARLKVLEAELIDRDKELHELRAKVQREELSASTVSSSTEQQLVELRQRVEEMQQNATEALAKCSALQKLLDQRETEVKQLEEEKTDLNKILEEKDLKIHQLEVEKAESEKLYRDLLERESPRSKGSRGRELHSASTGSVDDSFASARDSIHDTPRSHLSDALDFTSPRSDIGYEETKQTNNNADEAVDMCDSIPFANDSSDYQSNNGNNNNNTNNSSESASVEMAMEDLKRKVNELDAQLTAAKEREERIRLQLEETEHKHIDAIEMLKQELDHERKIEVETLHSEFRVQLDVELKRQAAELSRIGSTKTEPHVDGSVVGNTDQQDTQGSNNNAVPVQEPVLEPAHQPVTESDNCGENPIIVDPLMQTGGFDGVLVLEEPITPLRAAASDDSDVHENLSDDSKASTSPQGLPNPVYSSTPMPKRAQSHPLTDLEKEMEALRQEYEDKLSALKTEKEEAEDRYDRLMQGVQNGEHPELNQLMKDKYDEELELTKSLLQQEFDSQLKEEKKKFVEKHRKLMADFMEDREKEEAESNKKHAEEMERLRENLTKEYEAKLQTCEQRDADEQRSASSGSWDGGNTGNLGTSTPQARPDSAEVAVQCQHDESEEETDAERAPTRQVRLFADVVKSPSPSEVQEMEHKIQQLTSQVERLTTQLVLQPQNGDATKSPTRSPQHSPENDTLKDEDSALVAMLQSDLERISLERESVQRTNDRLLSLLSDSVKTYVGVEDTINRKLSQVVSGSTPRPPGQYDGASASGGGSGSRPSSRPASRPGSVELGQHQGREDSPAIDRRRATPDPDTSQDSHHLENTSILSNATDEGLEISQRLAESIFVGPDLDAEGEEILNDARSRLTGAVGQLLELMEKSTIQLMEAKATQQELLDTLAARAQEVDSVTTRAQDLDSQLAAEIQAKDYLGLELHKAEGLIAGYSAERESLEAQLQSLEEQREALILDLDTTRSRLEDFERHQTEMDSARQELGRQQELLRDNAGQEMQGAHQGGRRKQKRQQRLGRPVPVVTSSSSKVSYSSSSSPPSPTTSSSTKSSSGSTLLQNSGFLIPISVFLGAYILRRWWLQQGE